MSTVTIEVGIKQIEAAIKQLNPEEKIKLLENLEKETLRQRWDTILKDIDTRLEKFPVSEEEVVKEIKDYRKEKYAKSCH